MPGNRAVAYGKDIDYSLIEIKKVNESSLAKDRDKIIVGTELLDVVMKELLIEDYKLIMELKGSDLKGIILAHPLKEPWLRA